MGRNGQPAKSFSIKPRKNRTYDLEPGYHSAYRRLAAMRKDGLVKNHPPDFRGHPDLWSLPGIRQPKNWYSRKHEIDAADLFVALVKTRLLLHWDGGWQDDEQHFRDYKVNYDRRAELEGINSTIFFEVDRGTEDLETIKRKCEKYLELSKSIRGEPFNVIFTVQGYRWTSVEDRAADICEVLNGFKRKNQFLVTPHVAFRQDPLGKCIIQPMAQNTCISLHELPGW